MSNLLTSDDVEEVEEAYETLSVYTTEGKKEYRSLGGDTINWFVDKNGALYIKSEKVTMEYDSYYQRPMPKTKNHATTVLSPNYWLQVGDHA